jgi:molybdate transport system substrate-binding protein
VRRGALLALVAAALAPALAAAAAGCGGSDDKLTVYAASSLTEVFQELGPDHRYNFAGSDELATQLREGGKADVYAAASPRYPQQLYSEGLLEEPVVFATNELVLIVPGQNPRDVTHVQDLLAGGFKLVVGAEGVPVGDYTRTVLTKLGLARILDQVVSEEENVKGVLGKVALGEADAGFVYTTDAHTAEEDVMTIRLPENGRVEVTYPAAVVRASDQKDKAREFIDRLRSAEGRRALERAGFGYP